MTSSEAPEPTFPVNIAIEDFVKISVCIITFNHANYISECLESILRQKASFEIEILVRDDLSTDNTAQIVKSYVDNYPGIVRLIVGLKNIGANRNFLETFSHSKGVYLALCEGDDYWIDDLKLEKQVAIMDRYTECSFTAHPCRIHDRGGLGEISFFKSNQLLKFNGRDVLMVSGQYAPTASYMFRADALKNLPTWFGDAPVGDFFLELYGMRSGYGFYLPDVMSAYRTFSSNSWSMHNNEKKSKNMIIFSEKMIRCLCLMQADLIFKTLNFSRKKAAVNFSLAVANLMDRRFFDFSVAIGCSISEYKLSKTQYLLYKFKSFPRIAYVMYRMKRWSDSVRLRVPD